MFVRVETVVAPGIDRIAHLREGHEDGDGPADPERDQEEPPVQGHGRTLASRYRHVTRTIDMVRPGTDGR